MYLLTYLLNENDDALSHTLPRYAHSVTTRGDSSFPGRKLGTRPYQIFDTIGGPNISWVFNL